MQCLVRKQLQHTFVIKQRHNTDIKHFCLVTLEAYYLKKTHQEPWQQSICFCLDTLSASVISRDLVTSGFPERKMWIHSPKFMSSTILYALPTKQLQSAHIKFLLTTVLARDSIFKICGDIWMMMKEEDIVDIYGTEGRAPDIECKW